MCLPWCKVVNVKGELILVEGGNTELGGDNRKARTGTSLKIWSLDRLKKLI
jgi:hypothetical protein